MRKLILLLFLLVILPLAASAVSVEKDGLYYVLNSKTKTASVKSNPNEYSGTINIPESITYNGVLYDVTSIEDAFRGCSNVTSVTIPKSVTSINQSAFEGCSITSIIIPNSVTSIGNYAFRGCSGLASVTIPNSVINIGLGAFEGCSGLTSVTIPNSMTFINESAFQNCSGLTSVTIPNSVTSIDSWAFSGCCGLTSISIPNSVTSINNGAFELCSGLTSLTIPNSIKSIYFGAFSGCSGLTSVIIPNSVTYISDYAFSECSALTSITIPNSVTYIGNGAFRGCTGLTSVTIPNSVTNICGVPFYGCSGLTSIMVENDNAKYDSRDNCNAIIETSSNTLIAGCKSTIIPNDVTSIDGSAFINCSSLTSISIPKSVTSIGSYAFSGCSNLTSVTIPNSVTSIGERSFNNCSGLTSVTIPNSVTSIGDYAFWGCSVLSDVYIMATEVPTTGTDVFKIRKTLHVPKGCYDKYSTASPWKSFKEIVEIEGDDVSSIELKMTAQEENGLVRLQFNSVPNDFNYLITRTDANGAKVFIVREGSHYPDNVEYVDIPPAAGTYAYSLEMDYHDDNGERLTAKSNTVTVTIAEPKDEEKVAQEYGFITGRIECDKNPPVSGLNIKFSDDVTVNARGTIFSRQRIPVGEKLTMTVSGDDSHEYESQTVEIQPRLNFVSIKGTLKSDYKPNENTYDLAICSPVEVTTENNQHHAKFSVRNLSTVDKWSGILYINVVGKSKNAVQYLLGNKPTYHRYSDFIELNKGETKELDVVLTEIYMNKDTECDLYIMSQAGEKYKQIVSKKKSLAILEDSGVAEFPIKATFGKNEKIVAGKRELTDEEKEDVASLVLGLSSVTPGMDGTVGDLSSIQKIMLRITGKKTASEAAEVLYNWFGGGNIVEAINDPNFGTISSEVKAEIWKIYSNSTTPFTQTYWRKLVGSFADVANADLTIGLLHDLATATTSNNQFEQVLACASMIYQLTAAGSNFRPLSSMMYTYMVVGKAQVEAARQFSPIMEKRYLTSRLLQNRPYNGNDEGRVNEAIDFRIYIKTGTKDRTRIDFTNEDHARQIKSISIKLAHRQGDTPAEFAFTPRWKKDCIMLESDGKGQHQEHGGSAVSDANDVAVFYMEIKWSNGRVTQIPLLEETNGKRTDGVKFDQNGAHMQTSYDFGSENPWVYTVTLRTDTGEGAMADDIYLGNNKERK